MGRDYEALRRKILGKYGSLAPFAQELGITPSTLSLKLQGSSDWRRAEIESCIGLLELTLEEVQAIFF